VRITPRVTLGLNRKRPGNDSAACERLVPGPGRFGLSREKEAAGAARHSDHWAV